MGKYLISMAVYDTKENKRTKYTEETVKSLLSTTDPIHTRIFITDNNSCEETKRFLKNTQSDNKNITVTTLTENTGTAYAVNIGLRQREEGEWCVKIDNDVRINTPNWLERMAQCFIEYPALGILGLKRKDLPNSPESKEYPTLMKKLETETIEICGDIIGTCHMFNPLLLDKIGYLYQPFKYGFDDVLMCTRARKAGYKNAFLPAIDIDHIDTGDNPFTKWKKNVSGIYFNQFLKIEQEYLDGIRDLYVP